jgi:DNA-directed RNA polymerase subunit RPC12/RpoP
MSGREAKKVIVSGDPRKMPAGEIICLLHFTSTVEAVTITPSVIPVKMTVRPPKPPPPEPFVCSECGEVFETEDELGLHTEQEHEPPPEPFICSHCGAEFSTEGELQHHIEQEHPEPPEEPPPEEPEYNWLEKVIKWILDFFRGRK